MEKKKLFVVYSSHYIEPVDVLFEDSKLRPVAFYSSEIKEWHNADDSHHFFETEDEAKKYVEERQQLIHDKLLEFKAILDEYDMIGEDETTDVLAQISLKDILQHHTVMYSTASAKYYEKIHDLFSSFMRSNMVNINAYSFPASDVKLIKWHEVDGESRAQLFLKGGESVMTHNKEEYAFVCIVFGYNQSGRAFVSSTKKEGETQNKEA